MFQLSNETVAAYDRRLETAGVPENERADFRKWARFYLDFCHKYGHPPREPASVGPFLAKLASKRQSEARRSQASRAVNLLILRPGRPVAAASERSPAAPEPLPARQFEVREDLASGKDGTKAPADGVISAPSTGMSWEREYRDLEGSIKMRNYSTKTLAAYRLWTRKFQSFVRSKPTVNLSDEDVKSFLTDLAVREGVAASTQNQAFNALLFFYRHVLQREFGTLEGVVRAKRRPYVPVVLSRSEVEAVIGAIVPPYRLVALLLYGCGLRLAECLELRVHCFNLEARLLTIHDGKGQKDRSVPLPARILPEIRLQMEEVRRTFRADMEAGYAGTFLPRQLEKKFKKAAKDYIWQWFFPAATMTTVSGSTEKRRYHLHDSHVQGAVKRAAEAAGVAKRVSPHTFRHTFASHLLLAGYDLPTIQRLLGHGDVKTTMIYVQTVPTIMLKEVRSPLDLGIGPEVGVGRVGGAANQPGNDGAGR
ncbi:MAG: hypothetical protein QOE70_4741 [Chthoniobacter sp.]|jgi:integron integrase|nr:hypothetical protein [Chthoniobacter sp.]